MKNDWWFKVWRLIMKKILWAMVAAILLFFIFHFAIEFPKVRERAYSATCNSFIGEIGLHLHQYHQIHGRFPPAYQVNSRGAPVHSWRVLLLEVIDSELFKEYKFNEPWNGPNNCQLESRMPSCYSCPSDYRAKKKYQTNYFVVVGNDTLFPGPKAHSLKDIENPTSSTIMVVEAIGQGVHWMEPRDLNYDAMSFQPNDQSGMGVSSNHRKSPWVCMVDVSRRRATEFPINQFKEMFLIKSLKN
jgi:Protein of unknown function (DUF1559)